jgi:hypothetical protein
MALFDDEWAALSEASFVLLDFDAGGGNSSAPQPPEGDFGFRV